MVTTDIIQRVEAAIKALKNGKLIIVMDDENRESEGDMVGIADLVTPENVNKMVTHARGLLCVPMSEDFAKRLHLNPMIENSSDAFGTAFTISTDAKTTTTGISAFDRAKTIKKLADSTANDKDFYHPGHIFPLISRNDGLMERQGHTEAAVTLAKLAGANPVAYITEILKRNGEMARKRELKSLAEGLQMPLITVQDIKYFQLVTDTELVKEISHVQLPTKFGNFNMISFKTPDSTEPTLLIYKDKLQSEMLLRIHSECLTGDVFGSLRCDCGPQLEASLKAIEHNGSGAVLYLRQEGRGIGLIEKLKAYELQEHGLDTVTANEKLGFQADERDYSIAAAILTKKSINKVNLMTNNPDKINQLQHFGIEVTKRIPLEINPNKHDIKYLKTKKNKMHHLLTEV